MYDAFEEHCQSQPSSASEWDRADALQRGEENPEVAWICTDRDVWHPNPFYQGPPVPHPEAPEPREMAESCYASILYGMGQMQERLEELGPYLDTLRQIDTLVWEMIESLNTQEVEDDLLF